MYEMNRAHQGRVAIRAFQVIAHALLLRGRYRMGGYSGQALESSLRALSSGLFRIVYGLGCLIEREIKDNDHLTVHFRPSLTDQIMHQVSGKKWAAAVKDKLCELGLEDRPLHIISANLHSVLNLVYGYHAVISEEKKQCDRDLYDFILDMRDKGEQIKSFAVKHGFCEIEDRSGSQTNVQIIDASQLKAIDFHPAMKIDRSLLDQKPVLFIMDYAFGFQAFELMDELLQPWERDGVTRTLNVQSISVMGKAGILPGEKGDIMLATAHVIEGSRQ